MADKREPSQSYPATPAGVADGPRERPGGGPDGERYRPLSLLAVAALGVVLLGAGVIAGCSLVAFVRGQPWLHPVWAGLTLAGGVLSLVAWLRIRGSEGTLAGDNLARWGLMLSLLVGLSYLAYFAATYLALRQQADAFGREFLGLLAEGKTNQAFVLTQPPASRQVDENRLRQELEIRFNSLEEGGQRSGPLSQFEQMDLTRLLAQGGPDTRVEPQGLLKWEYANGGYKIQTGYKVQTPAMSGDVVLSMQGHESRQGEYEGRRWQLLVMESGLSRSRKSTPLGDRLGSLTNQSLRAVTGAQRAAAQGRPEELVLETLPPDQRDARRKAYPRDLLERPALVQESQFLGLAPLGPAWSPAPLLARAALAADLDRQRELFLPEYREFREGNLVRADEGVFWAADAARREAMARAVRAAFRHPSTALAVNLRADSPTIPVIRREGDRVLIEHDCQVMLPETRQTVEARLVTECEAGALDTGEAKDMRLRELKLLRGKALPANMPGMPPRMTPGS